MFRRFGRKKLFVIPLAFLILSLCLSAVVLRSASAASTLAQAGAASGRTIGAAISANLLGNNPYTTIVQTQFDGGSASMNAPLLFSFCPSAWGVIRIARKSRNRKNALQRPTEFFIFSVFPPGFTHEGI